MGYPHFSSDCMDFHDRVIDWGGIAQRRSDPPKIIKPKGVVTLCGSSRFRDQINEANRRLTLAGYLVLSLGLFGHDGDLDAESVVIGHPVKDLLDELHKRKIDMSNFIYVVDVDGYVGDSTRSEIAYAELNHKPVHLMSEGSLESEGLPA